MIVICGINSRFYLAFVSPGEQCDDGNWNLGDGWTNNWEIEVGWECTLNGTFNPESTTYNSQACP